MPKLHHGEADDASEYNILVLAHLEVGNHKKDLDEEGVSVDDGANLPKKI
jgi:hypothetical protein